MCNGLASLLDELTHSRNRPRRTLLARTVTTADRNAEKIASKSRLFGDLHALNVLGIESPIVRDELGLAHATRP